MSRLEIVARAVVRMDATGTVGVELVADGRRETLRCYRQAPDGTRVEVELAASDAAALVDGIRHVTRNSDRRR